MVELTDSTINTESVAHSFSSLFSSIQWESLNSLDIGVFVVVFLSVLFAMYRGFIGSMLSLTGWILSFWLTHEIYIFAQPVLNKHMQTFYSMIVGYSIIFFVLLIFFGILNLLLFSLFKNIFSGPVDKFLGAIFGFVRGIFIVIILFLCFSAIMSIFMKVDVKNTDKVESLNKNNDLSSQNGDNNIPSIIKESQTYPLLVILSDNFIEYLPEKISDQLLKIDKAATDANEKSRKEKSIISNSSDMEKKRIAIDKLSTYADSETIDKVSKIISEYKKNSKNKNINEKSLKNDKNYGDNITDQTLKLLLQNYKDEYASGKILPNEALPKNELDNIEQLVKNDNG